VARVLPGANAVSWAWAFGASTNGVTQAFGVATNRAGSVYVAGSYTTAFTWSGLVAFTAPAGSGAFVAKLVGASGAVAWALPLDGPSTDAAKASAADGQGNLVVGGQFLSKSLAAGTYTLNDLDATGTTCCIGTSDVFVVKLSSVDGSVVWASSYGSALGAQADTMGSNGVALDPAGYAHAAWSTAGQATVGATTCTAAGFVVHKQAAAVQWAACVAATPASTQYTAVTASAAGRAYACMTFRSATAVATGAPGTGTAATVSNYEPGGANPQDALVAAFNSATGAVLWATAMGGPHYDGCSSVATDASGNVYAAGWFSLTAAFGAVALTSQGNMDSYVALLSSATGAVQWAVSGGGTASDSLIALAVDTAGSVFFVATLRPRRPLTAPRP
jgi:hypothetical protein